MVITSSKAQTTMIKEIKNEVKIKSMGIRISISISSSRSRSKGYSRKLPKICSNICNQLLIKLFVKFKIFQSFKFLKVCERKQDQFQDWSFNRGF